MKQYFTPILLAIFAIFCGVLIVKSVTFVNDNHFTLLAESFIKNDLFLNPIHLPHGDFADYMGHQYIFYGPTPAIILIPFVLLFGVNFPQIYLSLTSLVLVYIGILLVTRKLNFSKTDSIWLSNFFVFGTVLYFVGLVNISAYLVQALGTVFVVFSLYEHFSKRRWILIGILVAIAGVTRINLYAMSVFYFFEIIRIYKFKMQKPLLLFLVPIMLSAAIMALYNFRRFGSVFDSGYTKHAYELKATGNNNELGYFSPVHVPAKLYLMLLASPQPVKRDGIEYVLKFPYLKADGYGTAILFTSPLFVYLVSVKRKPYLYSALVAIPFLMFPALIFSGTGSSQFGYRYSLDFLPLLFLVLLSSFKNGLTPLAKILITLGVAFVCLYMLSIWNSYPVFCFFKLLAC